MGITHCRHMNDTCDRHMAFLTLHPHGCHIVFLYESHLTRMCPTYRNCTRLSHIHRRNHHGDRGDRSPPNFWVHGTIYILVPPKFCLPLCYRTDTEYQFLQLNTISKTFTHSHSHICYLFSVYLC
jgi:hypothetical protein